MPLYEMACRHRICHRLPWGSRARTSAQSPAVGSVSRMLLEGVIEHYGVTSYAHQAEHESSEQPALWKSLSACDSEQQYCLTAIKLA